MARHHNHGKGAVTDDTVRMKERLLDSKNETVINPSRRRRRPKGVLSN